MLQYQYPSSISFDLSGLTKHIVLKGSYTIRLFSCLLFVLVAFCSEKGLAQCSGDLEITNANELVSALAAIQSCDNYNGSINVVLDVTEVFQGLQSPLNLKFIEGDLRISVEDSTSNLRVLDLFENLIKVTGEFKAEFTNSNSYFESLSYIGKYSTHVTLPVNTDTVAIFDMRYEFNPPDFLVGRNLIVLDEVAVEVVDFDPFPYLATLNVDRINTLVLINLPAVSSAPFTVPEELENLYIYSSSLTDLDGFLNMKSIDIATVRNSNIPDFTGLKNLEHVERLEIFGNSNYTDMTIFDFASLVRAETIMIRTKNFASLEIFPSLERIVDALIVVSNDSLQSLNGFPSLDLSESFYIEFDDVGSNSLDIEADWICEYLSKHQRNDEFDFDRLTDIYDYCSGVTPVLVIEAFKDSDCNAAVTSVDTLRSVSHRVFDDLGAEFKASSRNDRNFLFDFDPNRSYTLHPGTHAGLEVLAPLPIAKPLMTDTLRLLHCPSVDLDSIGFTVDAEPYMINGRWPRIIFEHFSLGNTELDSVQGVSYFESTTGVFSSQISLYLSDDTTSRVEYPIGPLRLNRNANFTWLNASIDDNGTEQRIDFCTEREAYRGGGITKSDKQCVSFDYYEFTGPNELVEQLQPNGQTIRYSMAVDNTTARSVSSIQARTTLDPMLDPSSIREILYHSSFTFDQSSRELVWTSSQSLPAYLDPDLPLGYIIDFEVNVLPGFQANLSDIDLQFELIFDDGDPVYSNTATTVVSSIETTDLADIRIFPNPTSNLFSIKGLEEGKVNQVEVHDILGRVVKAYSKTSFDDLSTSTINSGIYFIFAQYNDGSRVFVGRLQRIEK
ncbi:MAG: T9SS type A sorting domain-containing protein [Saprospiraceae bacterium]